jgi:protein tyrosine/serine phosphatase
MMFESLPYAGLASETNTKKSSPHAQSSHTISPKAVLPEGAKVSERIFNLPGLSNVGRVASNIYRGAQPEPQGYITLRKMGIRTVINLRSLHSEKKAVEEAGMKSVEVPMKVFKDVNQETVRKVIAIMADPANQPVYIHCALGQDRTGAVVAAYRMEVDRWSLAEAEAEMQAFGFNDLWYELKEFVRDYAVTIRK